MASVFSAQGSQWQGVISSTLVTLRNNKRKGKSLLKKTRNKFVKPSDASRYALSSPQGTPEHPNDIDLDLLLEDQEKAAVISQSYDVMRINVSGETFVIPRYRVKRWPQSLLGSPDVEQYYRPELGMYFFDRNRSIFEYILWFYHNDLVDFPAGIDAELLELELEFFRIGWRDLSTTLRNYKFTYSGKKEKAYAFMNDHNSYPCAMFYMILELSFIMLSIGQVMIEEDVVFIEALTKYRWLYPVDQAVTWSCIVFFNVDFIARLAVSLNRLTFFKEATTWFDILALIPYYAYTYFFFFDASVSQGLFEYLYYLKLFRVARCFKIIRRSQRLRIILKILNDCMSELAVMLVVWIVGILIAGSTAYIAENDIAKEIYNKTNPAFKSILESAWWAQITMAAIGYGDIAPVLPPGRIVATVVIFGSTILTAIPMTLIIRRFSIEYEKLAQNEDTRKVMGSTQHSIIRSNSKGVEDKMISIKIEEMLRENAVYSHVLDYRAAEGKKRLQKEKKLRSSLRRSARRHEDVNKDANIDDKCKI